MNSILPKHPLFKRLLFVGFVVVTVMTVSHTFLQYLIQQQRSHSRVINLAGRQRMLSQRLAKYYVLHENAPDPKYLEELTKTFSELEITHYDLSFGNSAKEIASAFTPELIKEYRALDPLILQMEKAISCKKEINCQTESQSSFLLVTEQFLDKMNRIVFNTDSFSSRSVEQLSRLKLLLFVLTLLIIIFTYFNILIPIFKNLLQSTESLKKKELLSRRLEEALAVGTWEYSPFSRTLEYTGGLKGVLQASQRNLLYGWPSILRCFHRTDIPALRLKMKEAINHQSSFEEDFMITTYKGNKVWVRLTGQLDQGFSSSSEPKVIGTLKNIHLQKIQEQQLEVQKQISQHQAKLASIGELAAGVGHEINNPLTVVQAQTERLLNESAKQPLSTTVLTAGLGKILKASERIAKIVLGLRRLARKDEEKPVAYDLQELLKDSLALIHEIYDKDGIEFNVKLTDKPTFVKGVPGKTQQSIMNLLSNSKDALMDVKGQRTIAISLDVNEKSVLINFEDTGQGIPKEVQERIFNPFFTTKRVNEGTGIGLSLSHSMIRDQGGSIELLHSSSSGTCFQLSLPLTTERPPSQQTPSRTATEGSHLNILIVDDEEDIRDILYELLEDFGHRVELAVDGLDGYKKFRENSFDVIISDVMMPNKTGPEMLAMIRQEPHAAQPRFYFITGGVNINFENDYDQMRDLFDGYFFKPFNISHIQKILVDPKESQKTPSTSAQ